MTTSTDASHPYTPRLFNATTKQRFFRARRVALARHCGGSPSHVQLTIIARIIRNEWDLLRLDAQLDAGEISAHAMRNRLAMENRLRLDLREIGIRSAEAPAPSIRDHLARKAAEKAAA